MSEQRGNSFANGNSSYNGDSTYNGAAGPYSMTIAGVPLNGVPGVWADQVRNGATAT